MKLLDKRIKCIYMWFIIDIEMRYDMDFKKEQINNRKMKALKNAPNELNKRL